MSQNTIANLQFEGAMPGYNKNWFSISVCHFDIENNEQKNETILKHELVSGYTHEDIRKVKLE